MTMILGLLSLNVKINNIFELIIVKLNKEKC